MNLPLVLSTDKTIPLHQRLQTSLLAAIAQGRIATGTALPSSRELAASLGISRPTVVRAYEELVRAGYLESQPGGKTYVAGAQRRPDLAPISNTVAPANNSDYALGPIGKRLAAMDLHRGAAADQPVLNFGAPPQWALPLHAWKQILRRNCANLDPTAYELSPHPFGHRGLRQATADYLKRRQGVDCNLDQLIVFSGSQSPLFFLAKLFIEPGDNVIVENPGPIGARNLFASFGARLLPAAVDDDGISIEAIKEYAREKIKLIYITPKFHDPTGVCLSQARRAQLTALAEEHDILIVEDAWDSDYCYISPDLPAMQCTAKKNTFYIYSFWKALYPLSTVACLLVPAQYVKVFETAKSLIDGINPVLEHYTLAEFITEGHLERHLKTISRQLAQQRQNLIEDLLTIFSGAISLPKQSAAFWLAARLDIEARPGQLLAAAEAAGIPMISTHAFYAQPTPPVSNEYLISFAAPDRRINFEFALRCHLETLS